MRTTLILDDDLMAKAMKATGLTEKTAVVHEGLRLLVQREAARRLAKLAGAMPDAWVPPRRRVAAGGRRAR